MKKGFILITAIAASVLFSNAIFAQSDELIKVYRWYSTEDKNYVTIADGEHQDGQLLNWGWEGKTLLFFAYRNPAPNRVAVNGWYNPVTRDFASVAEDEYTDDQMIKMGYTNKRTQFYALTRRGGNTVAVYRWKKGKDIVTIPEEGDTDAYLKKGYRHKTFQYFGIVRAADVKIFNQL